MPAVVAALVRSPLAERYDITVIPTYRDARPGRRALLFARALLTLAVWCARPGRRIVHVHMAARGSMYRKAIVVLAAKAMRRPVVLQVHAGPGDLDTFLATLGPMRRATIRRSFAAADRVVSVSVSGAQALGPVVPEGVEIAVIPNAPPSVVDRSPLRAGVRTTISYLGGFADPAKGGATLVEALPRLLKRKGLEIVLAGPGEAPDNLPADSRVRWLGWLPSPQKEAMFAATDLFAMPSLSEGLPMALLEAMAWGLPIVATRVGGVPELLRDGVDAVLIDAGDSSQLADALLGLTGDPERRLALGAHAAERVKQLADDDVYGKLDAVYRAVID